MTTLGVFIGRLQPPHTGHAQVLKQMLIECDHVLVLLGSSLKSRDIKNPLRWENRARLTFTLLQELYGMQGYIEPYIDSGLTINVTKSTDTLHFAPIKDYPDVDNRWQYQVQRLTQARLDRVKASKVVLYGNNKDKSSFYLKMFPQWERRATKFLEYDNQVLSSTEIRDHLLANKSMEPWRTEIGSDNSTTLMNWRDTEEGSRLVQEAAWIQGFKKPYGALPYPPIFQTADMVITWRGLVLLGKRRGKPGQGLWALPGGYVNAGERIINAAYRELGEESNTKVYMTGWAGRRRRLQFDPNWIVDSKTFDHPERSQRGRVITTAYYCRIPDHLEVQHRAGDDLASTKFFPIQHVLDNMNYEMFEDHQGIIAHFTMRF